MIALFHSLSEISYVVVSAALYFYVLYTGMYVSRIHELYLTLLDGNCGYCTLRSRFVRHCVYLQRIEPLSDPLFDTYSYFQQ